MKNKLLLLACISVTASTALGGPLFPKQINAFDRNFEKLGEYRYVYRFFFDLYEAALFAEPGATPQDVLGARKAFHLQFRYLREIDKSIILKSADRMLEKNLSAAERAAIEERVKTINEAYRTVREGDMSSLTYKPGVGTTLRINGEPVVTIEGKDFAELYFRIWLGPQAISGSLRDNLLGRN